MSEINGTIIRMFDIGEVVHYHLFNSNDDCVYCYNEDGDLLLKYDNNAKCYNKEGKLLATPHMQGGYAEGHWVFKIELLGEDKLVYGERCILAEGLLDTEVLVSKRLLEV